MKRPFIFAYSALVNDEITERTKKSGFDGCLDKLNALEFQGTVKTYLDEFIIHIIDKNIKNYSILEIMKRVIKDFDKKD
jgi:predicted house-cleaning noncanonical NTP pyrophosphatase (MazG superfamily)